MAEASIAGAATEEETADGTISDSSCVDANRDANGGIVQTVHYIPDALGYTHLESPAWEEVAAAEVVKVENREESSHLNYYTLFQLVAANSCPRHSISCSGRD